MRKIGSIWSDICSQKIHATCKPVPAKNGGGNMRKKVIVTLLTAICLVLSGCGSSGDSSVVSDAPYESEDASSDEEEYSEPDEYVENEGSVPEEAEDSEEVSGIIGMLIHNATQACTVQIVSIDPDTGTQHVISEFYLKRDNKMLYQWADSRCMARNWFTDDFTNMAVDMYLSETGECHAGWIDTGGNFTDVTEMSGLAGEKDFFNTAPVQHRAIGFVDGRFAFYDTEAEKVYCIPISSATSAGEVDADDVLTRLLQHVKSADLTCQVDNETYLTDYSATQGSPQSFIMNPETGEMTEYIPEADRCNWSGVLSPDGDMVAFLSEPETGGVVELYKMSMNAKTPTAISLQENSAIIVDISTLGTGSLALRPSGYGIMFQTMHEEGYCHLLEWR